MDDTSKNMRLLVDKWANRSQGKFAGICGVSASTISRYINKDEPWPNIVAIGKILRIPVDILGGPHEIFKRWLNHDPDVRRIQIPTPSFVMSSGYTTRESYGLLGKYYDFYFWSVWRNRVVCCDVEIGEFGEEGIELCLTYWSKKDGDNLPVRRVHSGRMFNLGGIYFLTVWPDQDVAAEMLYGAFPQNRNPGETLVGHVIGVNSTTSDQPTTFASKLVLMETNQHSQSRGFASTDIEAHELPGIVQRQFKDEIAAAGRLPRD